MARRKEADDERAPVEKKAKPARKKSKPKRRRRRKGWLGTIVLITVLVVFLVPPVRSAVQDAINDLLLRVPGPVSGFEVRLIDPVALVKDLIG